MPRRYASTSWKRGMVRLTTGARAQAGFDSEPNHEDQVNSAVRRGVKRKNQQGIPAGNYVRNTRHRAK